MFKLSLCDTLTHQNNSNIAYIPMLRGYVAYHVKGYVAYHVKGYVAYHVKGMLHTMLKREDIMRITAILLTVTMLISALFSSCTVSQPVVDETSSVQSDSVVTSNLDDASLTAQPADEELLSMLWEERIFHLYWTVLNGEYEPGEITAEDITMQTATELIMIELVQGGYPEFGDNVEQYLQSGNYIIPFDLLDKVSTKLFNTVYDWTQVRNIHLNGDYPEVVDESWHINLMYDYYLTGRKADIPYDQPVEFNPYSYPYSRIYKGEEFSDGSVVIYLSQDMYSDYSREGDFVATQQDEFRFIPAEDGSYYLESIKRSYSQQPELVYPDGVEVVERYEEYTGDYVTIIGDKILTKTLDSYDLHYHLCDIITGEVVATQSIPLVAILDEYADEYFNNIGDSFFVHVGGRYYELDSELKNEPIEFFVNDEPDKYLLFSPDKSFYIHRLENDSIELVDTASGEGRILEEVRYIESGYSQPTFSDLGLANALPLTDMAVEYTPRYFPVYFIDNERVIFAKYGYESVDGYFLHNIKSGEFAPLFEEVVGYGHFGGFTDTAYVGIGNEGVYIKNLNGGELITITDEKGFMVPDGQIAGERYVVALHYLNNENTEVELNLLDSVNAEMINTGVRVELRDYGRETFYTLPDGRLVVSMSLYGASVRFIVG